MPSTPEVYPACRRPVRGRGVDDPGGDVLRITGGDDFLGRRVGQAEDADVGRRKGGDAGRQILAQGGVDADQFDIGPLFQTFADLQARCADIAVDENLVRHGSASCSSGGV